MKNLIELRRAKNLFEFFAFNIHKQENYKKYLERIFSNFSRLSVDVKGDNQYFINESEKLLFSYRFE